MKENTKHYPLYQRLLSFAMAAVLVFGIVPLDTRAETTAQDYAVDHTTTVADPDTVSRPVDVYGDNTENAGKVTVGKSVSDESVTLNYGNTSHTFTPGTDNFIVTVSQTAQILGLASESSAPVDVVFVLDTSNSMSGGRSTSMVSAANKAIASLMAANEHNRVGVVAFSSYGSSVSDYAANQLSALAHYDDVDANNDGDLRDRSDVDAASNHLRWANSQGQVQNNGSYILGRGTNAGRRDAIDGGTNIHAGVALGAQMLTSASPTVVIDGNEVTRMPFLVILSDGAPTFSAYSGTGGNNSDTSRWYAPSMQGEQGPGGSFYAGNGFLAALTAAYYKGLITEHYYGTAASENNRCYIYTIGVGLENETGNAKALAQITMDPATYFASGSTNTFYNGNSSNDFYSYWDNYEDAPQNGFTVQVNSSSTYRITRDSINATKNYVNGLNARGTRMYQGGLAYNDDYFSANQTSDIESAFNKTLQEIQLKAMTSPTHVDAAHGEDFSGYVTFTDPIGEYMEVKKLYGLLADGYWFRGQTFAQKIENWGDDPAFQEHFTKVLQERCRITGATMDVASFIAQIQRSSNQAYYNSPADYDNSFVWWGNSFTAPGEEDEQVQYLDFADNDSIEYIEQQKAAGNIPAEADYVCRSYYFYGAAGGTVENPNLEYLHFVIRVQRSLVAPYQQTVVVSAPASLLAVEKVMVTETKDTSGNVTYSAVVTETEPARVVYEVGLRSDINAFNVDQILAADAQTYDYTGETAEFDDVNVYTNYDAATGTYSFYTNDWNRDADENGHERAMTKATFDAAADNSFYTYTEDTPIYVRSGNGYALYNGTTKPAGSDYYYAKEVYDWSRSNATGNTHAATKKTVYVAITIPTGSNAVKQGTNGWYVEQGTYKASSLTGGEDVYKPEGKNYTQTSAVVAHPHRTTSETNSHYTVYLGNNGKLTLTPADTKSVDITKPDDTTITDANGKVVMVGDILTYTIKVINGGETTADATVTDTIPRGTAYVENSASEGGDYTAATNSIVWTIEDIPAGQYVEVSFQVQVTVDALSGDLDVATIDNAASVSLSNEFSYTTNTTKNPPEGKKVVDTNGNAITGTVDIPDVLVYRIRWHNDSNGVADVIVTDIIPTGTSYVANSASHNGVYDAAAKTITWTLKDVAAGTSGVVSFRVNVNAAAGNTIENGAKIKIGDNNPRVTNKTDVQVAKGDLVLSKTVSADKYPEAKKQTFTLNITEVGLGLNGKFEFTSVRSAAAGDDANSGSSTAMSSGEIEFKNGIASLTILDGETVTIHGITAGAIISVTEAPKAGFTPAYFVNGATTASADPEGRVIIVPGDTPVSVAVENTYSPTPATFELTGTKKLETSLPLADTTFGFVASACDENGVVDAGASVLAGEVTVSSAGKEAVFTFAEVDFTEIGDYHFLISEIDGGITGITYAENQYLLTVKVTDNGSGTLQTSASLKQRDNENSSFLDATGVVFTNTYAPLETQLTLEANKVLSGRDLKAGEFSFVVTDQNGNVVTTGTNDAKGKITFRPITYTAVTPAGEPHVYTVKEVNSGLKGVSYSEASFTVTVKVEDKDGQLVATPTYLNGEVVFENTFTPDDVSLTLEGTKELTGRTMTAGEFSFRVTEVVDDKTVEVTTGRNDGNGKIIFTAIGYGVEDVGEHVYTVTEVKPDLAADPNMYYDPAVYQVKVTVSYDQTTGTLSYTTPEITKDGTAATIKFSNIQNPGYVDVPIVGKKQTTGNNVPANLSFSFSVVDMEGKLATGGSAQANGPISFTNLSYTTPGHYYYWIYETNHAGLTAHGVTYSAQRYLLEVTVTRDAYNKLAATTAYYPAGTVADTNKTAADYAVAANKIAAPADNVLFTNAYAAKGTANITATKTLEGKTLAAGDFMFKLERLDANGAVLSMLYASNAADGSISFPTILVDSNDLPSGGTATVRYIMSEVVTDANRLPGVTYSNAKYYLTITFTDNGEGNITNEVKYYTDNTFNTLAQSQTTPVFANSYAPEVGTQAVITAKKELSGRPLSAGEFSFNLYHVTTKDGVETETLVDTAVNAADGTVTFTRNYPAGVLNGADEITTKYVIREVNNNLGGVSYDDSNEGKGYPVTVKIVDNKDGSIGCTVTYTNGTTVSDVVFTNTYDAQDTTFTPEAKKVLENRTMTDREFSFVVREGNTVVSTGWSMSDGTVVFTPIGYTAKGTHEYTISEVKGNLPNVTYSNETFKLTVTVVDDTQEGKLVATGVYEGLAEGAIPVFTNTYTPDPTSVQLQATKKLENHEMRNGTFSFVVRDASGNIVATGGNVAAAANETVAVIFSNIGFNHAMLGTDTTKDFIYSISEQPTTHGGVTIDNNTYYAKVTLTLNSDGTLSTSVTYHSGNPCTEENKLSGVPAFVNKYEPAPVAVQLYADKTLINKDLETGEFTFTLKGEGIERTKKNDANGRATFDLLAFNTPGTYEYTISESVSTGWDASRYTLDNSFKVIIKVEDNLRGQLIATVTYHEIKADGTYDATVNLGGAEFINRYTAPPLTADLSADIDADKTVQTPNSNITYSPAGFTFEVTDSTGTVIKGRDNNGQTVDMIGTSNASGEITFPSFFFEKAGEYHYWITEVPGTEVGMTYDARTWEVHILVRYNEQTGLLYVDGDDVQTYLVGRAAAGSSTPSFVNVFEPTAVKLTLSATKILEGRDLRDREFLFYLMKGETIVAQGYNDVNGNVKFDLTYTADDLGSHAYTIKELVPEQAQGGKVYNGLTFDGKTYVAATVNVTYDASAHKLVASVDGTPVANGATVGTGVKITNEYSVEGTTATIHANKVITANRILEDQEFTFVLTNKDDPKDTYTAKNNAAGLITFQIPYTKAGVYTYTLAEQAGDDKSITYDTKLYTVTVTVTDDLLGKLHAVVSYDNESVPTFVNEYKAQSTTATIQAKKTLKGNKSLVAGDYTFELERDDGVKVTTTNLAEGVVKFELRYDAAGVYTYILREKAGEAAGVTYDDTEYKVIVTVEDDLKGNLEATVVYEGLTANEMPAFVNSYQGKAASVQITATKTLTGKTLAADAYSFTLTNKDNTKDVHTVKNDAKGNVVFDLNLTEAGTYTYVLAEATGTDANVTYDKNTYTVTVKVTDDLQGNLKAEVTYGTTDGKAPTFENIYTPSTITVELTGEKTLKGRDMKAEEFTFEVRDAAGKVVATAKNTAKGELVFSGIALDAAGKYTFEVTEVKGSVKGMIYDETKYIVTIEVANEDGVLKAAVTEPKGGLVFKNTYKDPDPTNPSTGDDMPLLLLVGLMLASAGGIVLMTTSRKKRRA